MKATVLTMELLQKWRNLIAELYKANISSLQTDEGNKLLADMRKTHNKIALAALSMDKYIMSITGLQGAGKTAFLKRYYNLDNSHLPENPSRGEDIPIIVYESNTVTEPVGRVLRVEYNQDFGIKLKHIEVSGDEFKNIAMKHQDQDVWLELVVPNRHFPDGSISFALLPGFENEQQLRSQELITHMLRLSVSSIVVVRKDLYSRKSNEKVFQVVQDLFSGASPIFILSHSDINPEHNEEMKKCLVEDFKLNDTETDRVLFTGTDRTDIDWIKRVTASINKYGFTSEKSEERRREMLEGMFCEVTNEIVELQRLLREEEKYLKKQHGEKSDVARMIFDFESMYEGVLKGLEREIKESLEPRMGEAKKQFENWIIENKGFIDFLKGKFSARAIKERHQLHDAISEAWVNSGKQKPEEIIVDTVTAYIDRQSKTLGNPLLIQEVSSSNSLTGLGQQQHSETVVEPKMMERIKQYFSPLTEDIRNENIVTLSYNELRTMTLIGAVLCRQAMIARPLLEQIKDATHASSVTRLDKTSLEKTVTDMEKFSSSLKGMEGVSISILKSIPVILGVDALIDGENDLLNRASQALNAVGLPVLPPHLMAILGGAFALTYGINAARAAVDDTNKRQLEFSYAGEQVIAGLPELQAQAFVNTMRRIFEKMAEQLQEVHSRKMGLYDNTDALEKVQYQLRAIKNLNGELRSMVVNRATILI